MKYWWPPRALTFIGPHTSLCINSNKSLALLPFAEKGLLVILPSKQDSQIGNGSITKELSIPSLTSLSILFRLIWPNLKCQSFVGFDEGSFLLDGIVTIELFNSTLDDSWVQGLIKYKPLDNVPEQIKKLFLFIDNSVQKLKNNHYSLN